MEEVKETTTALDEKGAAETDKPPSFKPFYTLGDIRFNLDSITDRSLQQFSIYHNQKAPMRGL